MRNVKYYFPGSILILLALLIVAVPEILVAFVAASILMVGIATLYLGHQMRKSDNERDPLDTWFFYKEPCGRYRQNLRSWLRKF
jgi:hypothetical protein